MLNIVDCFFIFLLFFDLVVAFSFVRHNFVDIHGSGMVYIVLRI